jgi:hypothetical protein
MIIQSKVKRLFENLTAFETDLKVQFFAASAWWFGHVEGYHDFHNLNRTGEAAAAVLVEDL